MKVYPKQALGCVAVGASGGAIDPKTHQKWVWAHIMAVAKLVDKMVSSSLTSQYDLLICAGWALSVAAVVAILVVTNVDIVAIVVLIIVCCYLTPPCHRPWLDAIA